MPSLSSAHNALSHANNLWTLPSLIILVVFTSAEYKCKFLWIWRASCLESGVELGQPFTCSRPRSPSRCSSRDLKQFWHLLLLNMFAWNLLHGLVVAFSDAMSRSSAGLSAGQAPFLPPRRPSATGNAGGQHLSNGESDQEATSGHDLQNKT